MNLYGLSLHTFGLPTNEQEYYSISKTPQGIDEYILHPWIGKEKESRIKIIMISLIDQLYQQKRIENPLTRCLKANEINYERMYRKVKTVDNQSFSYYPHLTDYSLGPKNLKGIRITINYSNQKKIIKAEEKDIILNLDHQTIQVASLYSHYNTTEKREKYPFLDEVIKKIEDIMIKSQIDVKEVSAQRLIESTAKRFHGFEDGFFADYIHRELGMGLNYLMSGGYPRHIEEKAKEKLRVMLFDPHKVDYDEASMFAKSNLHHIGHYVLSDYVPLPEAIIGIITFTENPKIPILDQNPVPYPF